MPAHPFTLLCTNQAASLCLPCALRVLSALSACDSFNSALLLTCTAIPRGCYRLPLFNARSRYIWTVTSCEAEATSMPQGHVWQGNILDLRQGGRPARLPPGSRPLPPHGALTLTCFPSASHPAWPVHRTSLHTVWWQQQQSWNALGRAQRSGLAAGVPPASPSPPRRPQRRTRVVSALLLLHAVPSFLQAGHLQGEWGGW